MSYRARLNWLIAILTVLWIASATSNVFAQFQGDVRLTRTGVMTPASSQGVLYASTTQGGVFRGSATSADVSLLDKTGAVQVSIGESAYTNNAATWQYGANWTASRSAGTLATGLQRILQTNISFTGDAGGATSARGLRFAVTAQGANAFTTVMGTENTLSTSATNTITTAQGINSAVNFNATGNTTTASTVTGISTLSSSGNVTQLQIFDVAANAVSLSSTGTITTLYAYRAGSISLASVNTAVMYQADNQTTSASVITASFRSAQNSGTSTYGFIHTGTAINAFNGSTKFGATTTPTQVIDVAGNGIFTGTVQVGAGSATSPSIAIGSADKGFYEAASGIVGLAPAGAERQRFSATVHTVGSGVTLGWASTAASSGTVDTSLVRSATAGLITVTNGFVMQATTQANLGAQTNGTIMYCSDCTFANPCAGAGTGAFAKRLNGAWRCD